MNRETTPDYNNARQVMIALAYEQYSCQLHAYIKYRIGNSAFAEDMLQDTFLRILEYKTVLHNESLKWLLWATARNLVTDYLRRHYRFQRIAQYYYDYMPAVSDDLQEKIHADDLARVESVQIERLSAGRRNVYLLYRFDEQSAEEISHKLNLSKRTVENHLFAARKQVREAVKMCI